jgi:hypothetical protein
VTRSGRGRIEAFATILLSIAALCTSWAGYQATLWGSRQNRYSAATTAMRTKSSRAIMAAGQLQLLDIGLFTSWLRERVDGKTRLAQYMEGRFRAEFKPAFAAWMATRPFDSGSAAPSPFSLPEYRLAVLDSAEQYDRAADSTSTLSRTANGTSDGYVLAAVILATVMFFGTSAQHVDRNLLRWLLLALATLACVAGSYQLLMLPRA